MTTPTACCSCGEVPDLIVEGRGRSVTYLHRCPCQRSTGAGGRVWKSEEASAREWNRGNRRMQRTVKRFGGISIRSVQRPSGARQ